MGKEIVRPTNPNFQKLSLANKVVRIGLVPFAIVVGTILDSCSKKSSPPSTPTRVSDNSSQFPKGVNDGPPLKNSTPTLTPKKEAPTPTKNLPIPTEVSVNKLKISKKPEELFNLLLTTPLQQNELPAGMKPKGASASALDETAKALKTIGVVSLPILENNPDFFGQPNGAISYTILPNSSTAKNAYDIIVGSLSNPVPIYLSKFSYPAIVSNIPSFGSNTTAILVLIDNVVMTVLLVELETTKTNQEQKATKLAISGANHLLRVGN